MFQLLVANNVVALFWTPCTLLLLNLVLFQLVTIIDPVSQWIVAENIPVGCDNIPQFIANFMFKTFCTFGFPRTELVNFNTIQFGLVEQEYNNLLSEVSHLIPNLKTLQGKTL